VPQVVSPLVGEMAGRPERVFLYGLSQGRSSLFCSLTMAGLQLALGTMSLLLMIGMTLWMLAEALLPERRELPVALGAALILAGASIMMVAAVT
jgi:predicted metal-binding membrane protein